MATVESQKTSKKRKLAAAEPSQPAGARPRRRRLRLLFWLPLALLLVVVALGPTLVSYTPLGGQLVDRFAPVDGTVEIGSLSVGWFSPLAASQVTLRNAQGNVVASVETLSGDKSLVQLILDRSNLGHFDVTAPELALVLRSKGSNLEDVLAPLLAGGSDGAAPAVAVSLKVVGGSATIDDQVSGRKYQINSLAADVAWDSSSTEPLSVAGSAKLVDANRTADVTISLGSQGSETAGALGSGHLKCQIDRLPLDVAEPLLRRRIAGGQLAGNLSARLDCTWGGGPKQDEVSVQGQIDATDLLLGATALGHDRIEMARLTVPCQIVGTAEQLRIDKLILDCDLGRISATGTIAPQDFAAGSLLAAAGRQTCQLSGKLDLMRLAALLPETLAIRSGTQITAGDLNVSLASGPAAGGVAADMSWHGKLETSDLEAIADGVALKWQQPLAVEFQAHDGPAGPVIDKVNCDASFMHVEAAGTLDQFTTGATFDLSHLASQLAQFVDLGGCQLAGKGQLQLIWQRDSVGRVQSQLDVSAHDFALATPSHRPWQEPSVMLHVEAAGTMTGNALTRVDMFSARFEAGSEQFTAQLSGPLDNPLAGVWPVQIGWQGDIAGLMPRAEVWLGAALAGWEAAGVGTLAAQVQLSSEGFDLDQCRLAIQRLHVWGHGLYLDEPQAEINATARWRRAGASSRCRWPA